MARGLWGVGVRPHPVGEASLGPHGVGQSCRGPRAASFHPVLEPRRQLEPGAQGCPPIPCLPPTLISALQLQRESCNVSVLFKETPRLKGF